MLPSTTATASPGSFADRSERAREWDQELLPYAPDMVLVLLTAAATTVAERMAARPRVRGLLNERDIPYVLDRFQDEYDASLIERKFTLDTTDTMPQRTVADFVDRIHPHLSEVDRQPDSLKLSTLRCRWESIPCPSSWRSGILA